MAVTVVIDERIAPQSDEYKLISNAIAQMNLNAMDLPPELCVSWRIDNEVNAMSTDRHYEVYLTQPGWLTAPFFGVALKQLRSPTGFEEFKREFNWALGDYYLNRVRKSLKELESVGQAAEVAS